MTAAKKQKLIADWKHEEDIARIVGWDFSHIEGRYFEDTALPRDYRDEILKRLKPDMKLLDIDTGGGEFLLSLGHTHELTAATENYPPNVSLCRDRLIPLGIDFRQADGNGILPYDDGAFDMVIDRHGDFNAKEIYRVLKPGGMFITQQVGAYNDRRFVELLLGDAEIPFPDQKFDIACRKFEAAGFNIVDGCECFRPIRFFDVGALVWFARIIEWEFIGFSVDRCLDRLMDVHRMIVHDGFVEAMTHRFFLATQKQR